MTLAAHDEPRGGRAKYLAYRGLGAALSSLPGSVSGALATAAGSSLAELWRSRRPAVRSNLRHVLGPQVDDLELERAVVAAFHSYARYWVEASRIGALSPLELDRRFSIEGLEYLDAATAAGRGAIIVLPHSGTWEFAGAWLAKHGYPLTVVAEVVHPPELFSWFVAQREALGLRVLPLASGSTAKLLAVVRSGGVVALLADRDVSGAGVPVSFFGAPTTLPGGPALLSLRSGAPIVAGSAYFGEGDRHFVILRPPITAQRKGALRDDVVALTGVVASELEALISRAPEQWHCFQPNWPEDRPGHEALGGHVHRARRVGATSSDDRDRGRS